MEVTHILIEGLDAYLEAGSSNEGVYIATISAFVLSFFLVA